MSDGPELSVVIPVMNEEDNVQAMHDRLLAALDGEVDGLEIVWVDDGSTDSTWGLIQQLAVNDPRIRGLSFSRNFGHQIAVTAGVDAARGDAVVIIDGDLQDPPEVIPEMIEKWRDGFQVVYGQRDRRDGETLFKKVTSVWFYRLLRRLAHIEIPVDTGDFRLMGPKALAAFRAMPEHNRFVRGMVSWIGFPQTAVRFERQARMRGETNYPLKNMVKLALSGITSFSFVPLRVATWLGLGITVFAIFYPLLRLVLSLLDVADFGSAGLVSAIFFLAGVQLLAIGALGEYMARVFEEAVHRPLYLVKEHTGGEERVTPPSRQSTVDS